MERRKLQNREAQRRYRENIKRKLKMAERQLEDRRVSTIVPDDFAIDCGNEVNRSSNIQDGVEALDCPSPTLGFDWMSLNSSCDIQDGLGLLSPPESALNHSPTQPASGSTVMHIAAQKGYHTIVRILSESAVDIAARDYTGQTPLHLAAAHGHTSTIVALIEAGAEVDAKNDQGQTPLFAAVNNGEDASVKILLERGADPNARVSVVALGVDTSIMQDNTMERFSMGAQNGG